MSFVKGKVCFVGDTNVGKTTIICKFAHLENDGQNTVGATSIPVSFNLDGRDVQMNIWDTAGQEEYRALIPMYVRMSQIGVLVYDVSVPESFEHVKESWFDNLKEQVEKIVIVGNKCDLEKAVGSEEALAFCESKNVRLVETSGLTEEGLDTLFRAIAELVVADEAAQGPATTSQAPAETAPEPKNNEKKGCCTVC